MLALGVRPVGAALGEVLPRETLGAALRLMQQSAAVAGSVLPQEAGLEWRELANKLEAFECFQQASTFRGLAPGAGLSLEEELQRTPGSFPALWTAEGLGYALAESAWAAAEPRRRLLADLPDRAVIPLHTGAALSFASRLLAAGQVRSAGGLERWIALWEENAHPGYRGLAAEALGLVTRNLYPHRALRLGELLRSIAPELADSFWHGVGRGLYFAPTHVLPWSGAAARALEKAWREPPYGAGRRNATAGFAWALTLVNVRHPEVLAGVLSRQGREIRSAEAFANGVASAVLIWYDVAGLDPHLAAFLDYRPEEPRPGLAALWRELVLAPCETAVGQTYPKLRQSGGLAALFRCPPSGHEAAGP
ncbi:MAG TPA: hypothetical protein VF173_21775 [Thermoanaerobaculia bacterium]|nr:hypothetical protein [Thermoanaerobaculia bacterium]